MEKENLREEKRTTLGQRFCGFAMGHLILSVLLVFFGPIFLASRWNESWLYLAPIFLMGIYFPAGVCVSWVEGWTVPQSDRERMMAIILPAAVAWFWVCVVFFAISVETGELLMVVFYLSMILATPSSILAILFAVLIPSEGWGGLMLGGMIAGFLPPLLFELGSFWQSDRMERIRIRKDMAQVEEKEI